MGGQEGKRGTAAVVAPLPLAVVLALAAGVFGRAHPGWGCALFLASAWTLARGVTRACSRAVGVVLLVALAGAGWSASGPLAPTLLPMERRHRFWGFVPEDPSQNSTGLRLLVEVVAVAPPEPGPWTAVRGRIALQVEGLPDPLPGRGDAVIFRGRLRPPWGLRNPGSRSASDYLLRKEVEGRAFAKWPGEVVFAGPGPGTPLWLRWRRKEAQAMTDVVRGQAGAVLAALTVGDWTRVLPQTSDSFRRAGTTHLLAISGLHLGIVALLTLPAVRWVLLRVPLLALARPVEPIARLCLLPLLWAYVVLSGLQASTLRSLAMAALLVVGGTLSRPLSAVGVLTSAVAILGVWSPTVLGDPGLQLSVAALAGLFWLAPRIETRLAGQREPVDPLAPPQFPSERRLVRLGLWVRRLAVAGLSASVATAPVSAFHFGSSSLLGIGLNLFAVPLVEFLCLPTALLGTALHSAWPWSGEILWRLAGMGLQILLKVQERLAPEVPVLSSPLLETPAGCLGALLVLASVGFLLEKPLRLRRAAVLSATGCGLLLIPPFAGRARDLRDGRIHLWALDVGQGQALILRLPKNRWVLVDAGGFPGSEFDTGERLVVPALRALGAQRLWLVVSTHPHPDHAWGLPSAIRLARPERVWLPATFSGDARYLRTLEAAGAAGATVEWLDPATGSRREEVDSVRIDALWTDEHKENDRSLVLRVSTGKTAALLPADAEAEAQAELVSRGVDLGCELLVAPHHGSSNAVYEPFLRAARPRAVFVSAAGRNGLPSGRFLSAARSIGAVVYGTYESGALHAILGPEGVTAGPAAR